MSRHDDEHRPLEAGIHIRGLSPGDVALFRNLADESAKEAVNRFAIAMGLDPTQPLVSQRYFQTLRKLTERAEEDTADAEWVRRWRPRTEGLFGKVAAIILSVSVPGALIAFWTGLRAAISSALPSLPHP